MINFPSSTPPPLITSPPRENWPIKVRIGWQGEGTVGGDHSWIPSREEYFHFGFRIGGGWEVGGERRGCSSSDYEILTADLRGGREGSGGGLESRGPY